MYISEHPLFYSAHKGIFSMKKQLYALRKAGGKTQIYIYISGILINIYKYAGLVSKMHTHTNTNTHTIMSLHPLTFLEHTHTHAHFFL